MLKSYLKRILQIASRGDATEESYYSAVEELLNEYAESTGKKNIHVTPLPKKTEAGNPDFRVWDGKQHITGYIEAKAPTVEDLDRVEGTDQLERYLGTFPNVILTNFFEFRLYRNGGLIDKVLIDRPFIVHKLKTAPPIEKEAEFLELLDKFFSFSLPRVRDARSLATELANRTRFLRDEVVARELREEEQAAKGILGFYEAFKEYLISGLSKEDFADLYSQTITYGLFAARLRSENGFNRKLAYDRIPRTIGILRDVFRFISLEDLPPQMEWIVDDISEVLAVTDVKSILHKYFHEHKGKDPVVHFYETFLTEYNPETREKRGVYYTPEPVVSYIVRSLDIILKEHSNRVDGFASDTVTVLDPAAGTLTFLAEAAKLAVGEFVAKYGKGGKEKFIKEHILKNFYAFELMMAPYAVGHLKMSFLLEELGYKLQRNDRFKLYLTNTLEMEDLAQTELPGMISLSAESHLAGKVKKQQPILVILGNPPYSGISANLSDKEMIIEKGRKYITHFQIKEDENGGRYKLVPQTKVATKRIKKKQKTWIGELIEYYKIVDGEWFGERKHWLHDDYVKFIRFAQWKIDQIGEGTLGFITNHSYLDNPTFRGMRQSLMSSFNEIYVLDLHGNSLKKEKCPDGSKDENVFDIQQGVAVALFIKKKNDSKKCRVQHAEIWGLRKKKEVAKESYEWLLVNSIKTPNWKNIRPVYPYYFFVPVKHKGRVAYERNLKTTEIFPVNVTGIQTSRDRFVVDFDKKTLKRRISIFRDLSIPDQVAKQGLKLKDTRGWKLAEARKQMSKDEHWERYFTQTLYRPFDLRHICYTQKMIDWPRLEVMRNMARENLGLSIGRQWSVIGSPVYDVVFVADTIIDVNSFRRGGQSFSPLYLYPEDLFTHKKAREKRRPNINSKSFKILSEAYHKAPAPENILYYVYAILYSNVYRAKYADFLKKDFPRIPFTRDYILFGKTAELGKRLADLHLLKSTELDPPAAKFQGKGDNRVEKVKYEGKQQSVHISRNQYFERVAKQVWEYQIGGYQVCEKWLKDRKGRQLSLDDIKHYCKIVTALAKTIEIQKEIDDIYPEVEKETIEFGES